MAGEGMRKSLEGPETGLFEILQSQRGYCAFLITQTELKQDERERSRIRQEIESIDAKGIGRRVMTSRSPEASRNLSLSWVDDDPPRHRLSLPARTANSTANHTKMGPQTHPQRLVR
jgi:hypothetical protein